MVTHCVCFDVSFVQMKELIEQHNVTSVAELHKCVQFGEKCELCLPFVEQIFATGETTFEVDFSDPWVMGDG